MAKFWRFSVDLTKKDKSEKHVKKWGALQIAQIQHGLSTENMNR